MAGKLTKEQKGQLEEWIGRGPAEFNLLYSIGKDTCDAKIFHTKCNNKGPTVTVLYNASGSVYGGYTSQNWLDVDTYLTDDAAFLFRLQSSGSEAHTKFPVTSPIHAIYCHSAYGPIFGGGHDLCTFTGTVATDQKGTHLNGSVKFGQSYDMQGVTTDQITNGNLTVTDLEVYAVKVTEGGIGKEWRKSPDWTEELLERLMAEIEFLAPIESLSIPKFNILMVGPVGAGKSSFFNTITSAFRGYITSQAASGSAEHSLTTMYRMYQLRASTSGNPLNFRLCDTQGLEEGMGLDSSEINLILDGHIPDLHQFNPSSLMSHDTPGFVKFPGNEDKIHCVCFMIDGSTIDVLSDKMIEKIRGIQSRINLRGIPQVVLLMKVDKICPQVADDLSRVFRSSNVQKAVDKVSQVFGIPRGNVLPMKNYESETDLDEKVNILAMMSMRKVLRAAQDHMFNLLDQASMKKTKLATGSKE